MTKFGLRRFIALFLSCFYMLFFLAGSVLAVDNPLSNPNNPFGIHILQDSDIDDAAALVNSTGGDWGYITLVIRKDERDTDRFQNVFNKLRRKHIIPIVRIATLQKDGGWEKPSVDEIDGWASFLDSLNWVVKNRYVIIGNEPNHAKEWGGSVNPEDYTDYLISFANKLKDKSNDFFILPAGLDASAPDSTEHLSESAFIQRMLAQNKDVFNYIDGWTSHSYPNPNFSGPVDSEGKGSLKTYQWELGYLKSLGINRDLPVFITETGWAHNMDYSVNGYKKPELISDYMKKAFEIVWKDQKVVAITPFVLNYQNSPFDIFSWKKKDGKGFYDFYYEVQKLPKTQGKPQRVISGKIKYVLVPQVLKNDQKKYGIAFFENDGQAIWEWDRSTVIKVGEDMVEVKPISVLNNIEPNEETFALFARL